MGTALEVVTYKGKRHNIAILSWKFQTHMELIFKYFAVETKNQ